MKEEIKRRSPFAISSLVPEIFKFAKRVKYANEMTLAVIHTQQILSI